MVDDLMIILMKKLAESGIVQNELAHTIYPKIKREVVDQKEDGYLQKGTFLNHIQPPDHHSAVKMTWLAS